MVQHGKIIALFAAAAGGIAVIFYFRKRAPKIKSGSRGSDNDSVVELDKESDLSQRGGMVAEREVCDRDFMVDQQDYQHTSHVEFSPWTMDDQIVPTCCESSLQTTKQDAQSGSVTLGGTWTVVPGCALQVDGGECQAMPSAGEGFGDRPAWSEGSESLSELDLFGRLPPPYGYEEAVTAFDEGGLSPSLFEDDTTFSPPHEFKDGVWNQDMGGNLVLEEMVYNAGLPYSMVNRHCSTLYTHYEESETESDSGSMNLQDSISPGGQDKGDASPEPLLFDLDSDVRPPTDGAESKSAGGILTVEKANTTEHSLLEKESTLDLDGIKAPTLVQSVTGEGGSANAISREPSGRNVETSGQGLKHGQEFRAGAEYVGCSEHQATYSDGGGKCAMSVEEREETLSHVTEDASVMTPDEARVLTAVLSTSDHTLLERALVTVCNAAAFTKNQKLLRDAGCLKRLVHVLHAHDMALRVGQSVAYPAIVTRVVNTVTNLAADEENQKQLQECIPALIDFAKSESAPESVQVSSLQALINLSVTSAYHPPYTQLIQHLYECLDTGSHTLQMHALKVLINLSCNPEMVPHLLAAKAPGSLLAAVVPGAEEDHLLRWVTLLANVMWTAREKKLTNTSLPTEYKAPSPETMWTAIYGLNSSVHLRSKVFVLSKHRNQEIRYHAARIYSCLV